MTIKCYDIIEYNGRELRVMGQVMDFTRQNMAYLVEDIGWLRGNDLKVVKPFHKPDLLIGDIVIVNPITDSEKSSYPPCWSDSLENLVGEQCTITDYDPRDETYKLDDAFWVCPYHLEKLPKYDIV